MVSSTNFTSILCFLMILRGTLAGPTTYTYPFREVTKTTKAGLAWPVDNANTVDIKQYENSKVSWYYTWTSLPVQTDLEFTPMLWGPQLLDQFTTTIEQTLASGNVTAVMGMNEPEQPLQANMSVVDGVQMWKAYMEPLRTKGVRLGSPSPSSAPEGKKWLQDFFSLCGKDCTVDFISTHWYGTNASQFIEYVNDYHNTFQRPLWITEWACQNYVDTNQQCSQDDVVLFLNTTQTFLDSADFVERYSWFGAMENLQGINPDNALMDSKGTINALGKQYISKQVPQASGAMSADGPTTATSSTNSSASGGGGIIFSAGSTVMPPLWPLSFVILFIFLS